MPSYNPAVMTPRREETDPMRVFRPYALPPVDAETERELLVQAQAGDKAAIDTLIKSNMGFCIDIASVMHKHHRRVAFEDMVAASYEGLLEGILRYDTEAQGCKLISYAVWWMRQRCHYLIKTQSHTVRMPFNYNADVKLVNEAVETLTKQHPQHIPPSLKELSRYTTLPLDRVKRALRGPHAEVSLDINHHDHDDPTPMMDIMADHDEDAPDVVLEKKELRARIEGYLDQLAPRETVVLRRYFGFDGHGETLQEIASDIGLTRERVRQIRNAALEKVRKLLVRNALLEPNLN